MYKIESLYFFTKNIVKNNNIITLSGDLKKEIELIINKYKFPTINDKRIDYKDE